MDHGTLLVDVARASVAKELLLYLHLGVFLGVKAPIHELVSKVKDDESILSMVLHVIGLVLADQHGGIAHGGGLEVVTDVIVGALAGLLLHEPRHTLVVVGLILHPVHDVESVELPELTVQKGGDRGGIHKLADVAVGDVVGDAHCYRGPGKKLFTGAAVCAPASGKKPPPGVYDADDDLPRYGEGCARDD